MKFLNMNLSNTPIKQFTTMVIVAQTHKKE